MRPVKANRMTLRVRASEQTCARVADALEASEAGIAGVGVAQVMQRALAKDYREVEIVVVTRGLASKIPAHG